MSLFIKLFLSAFLLNLSLISTAQSAGDYARTFERKGPVNDFAELLRPWEEERLTDQLEMISIEMGMAYSVCIIHDLGGFPIRELATEIGNKWQSGSASKNYGILLLIAKKEKEVFIATSKRVRSSIPDTVVQRIVNERVIPPLENGSYYTGISNGIDQLQFEMEKSLAGSSIKNDSNRLMNTFAIVFVIILGGLLAWDQYKLGRFDPKVRDFRVRGNSRSGLLTGPDSSGDFSSGGDSSGGGDGFGGGGAGGSFGGDGGGDSSD